jgi:hypothetical protein
VHLTRHPREIVPIEAIYESIHAGESDYSPSCHRLSDAHFEIVEPAANLTAGGSPRFVSS